MAPEWPPGEAIRIAPPDWLPDRLRSAPACRTDEEMVSFAIELARENVLRESGGPFGAAVFEAGTGRLLGAGVNSVRRLGQSVLHAEVMALMIAEARTGSHTLRRTSGPPAVLAASCDPCAMCLGAILWGGVGRLVCAAAGEDARRIGFEEGPVFPESFAYLAGRGIEIVRGVRGDAARQVLDLYRERGGPIYNG